MADSILRLKVESQEYDAKLKRAAEGLNRYVENCRKVGGTLEVVEKDTLDFVRAMGQMEATAKTASGKLSEMKRTFTEWGMVYKQMTDAEKQSPVGKALAASLDQLKGRIQQTKRDMESLNQEMNGSKFGQFGSIIDGIGQKMGLNANITELVTSKTAMMTAGISAATVIIGKATEAWAKYNSELSKQDQITTVTTGLDGAAGNKMTDQARAIVDTYKVDFREAINAANTLMTQFGESGEGAMMLIRDGMRGMIQGDGPKLLSMIQQYAPSFRDAGISASQLVAIIQNSEGGIFTDQNMNAIVMGIKNIRLMTNSTAEALAKMGIDGQEMTRKLNDGTMTIFEAMQKVSNAINQSGSASQAAGEVMQQVFGRQGAAAGTKLGEAIATLNTNLQETKRQTGELGDSLDELYEANLRLNTAIRDAFGYDGWEQMANGIKSKLIGALSDVIEHLAIIEEGFGKIGRFFGGGGGNKGGNDNPYMKYAEGLQGWINQGKNDNERRQRYDAALKNLQEQINNIGKEYSVKNADGSTSFKIDSKDVQNRKRTQLNEAMGSLYATRYTPEPGSIKPITSGSGRTSSTAQQAAKSIEAAEQEYARQLEKAALEVKGGTITTAQQKQKELQATEALWTAYSKASDTVKGTNEGYKAKQEELGQKIVALGGETKSLQDAQKQAEEAYKQVAEQTNKIASAQEEVNKAISSGNLKAFYQGNAKLTAAGGQSAATGMDMSQVFGATTQNIDAFIQNLKQRISESDVGTDLNNNLTKQLADAQMLGNMIQLAVENGVDVAQFDPKTLWTKIFGDNPGDYIDDAKWEEIRSKMEKIIGKPITIDVNTGNIKVVSKDMGSVQKSAQAAASAFSSVGSALNSIEDPAAKVMGTIAQAIATIALAYAEASKNAAMNPANAGWGWIAFAAAGAATMISTISAIHSATGYANGGIVDGRGGGMVPGNYMSGDMVPAMLNSQEVVLNRAQTNNLASQLEGGGMQNMQLSAVITGEQIRLVLNNNGRRTGRGEYVTTNFTRG